VQRLALIILLISTLIGCGKNRIGKLTDRTEKFSQSLRWASLKSATVMIAEENRKTVLERLAVQLNRNRIIDFSIIDLGLDKEKKKGSVLVEYSYIGLSDQTLHYRQELQSWNYNTKKRNWFLVNARDLPHRKK